MKFFHGLKHAVIKNVEDRAWTDNTGELWASFLRDSRTILFSREQAEVFLEISSSHTDTLDYRLPFPFVFLQFSSPVPIHTNKYGDVQLCCLLLVQLAESEKPDADVMNSATGWCKSLAEPDMTMDIFAWEGGTDEKFLATSEEEYSAIKSLAIACIGYINCENIYLYREEGASEAVNRKRERQGKAILEPYYVCHIRGVQYDANGEPISEGSHHGIRYDVRGHFRRLPNNKTTWVRPHQRGLQNELYVPKTYVVQGDKK